MERSKANRNEGTRKKWYMGKCEIPAGKQPVGCKWIFTVKHRADGTVERYKTRLVAK